MIVLTGQGSKARLKCREEKRRNKSEGRGDRPGAGGPRGRPVQKVKLGAGTRRHKASSMLAAGAGRARCEHVQQRQRGHGAGDPGPGSGGQPGAPTPASTPRPPPPHPRRKTRFPGPASWEKWQVRFKNLGWLTWCGVGNTAHTSRAAPEIHFVSKDSHFNFGGTSTNAFLPQSRHRRAQRRGGCGYSLLMTLLARIIMMITITIVVISGS